jgi:hypothetical protein
LAPFGAVFCGRSHRNLLTENRHRAKDPGRGQAPEALVAADPRRQLAQVPAPGRCREPCFCFVSRIAKDWAEAVHSNYAAYSTESSQRGSEKTAPGPARLLRLRLWPQGNPTNRKQRALCASIQSWETVRLGRCFQESDSRKPLRVLLWIRSTKSSPTSVSSRSSSQAASRSMHAAVREARRRSPSCVGRARRTNQQR